MTASLESAERDRRTVETRKTICPLDCPDACGIVATLDDGIITRIDGDSDHPFTKGFLCKKVRTYHDRVQSDERVLYPQKRVGAKGEGRFERISWDEAWTILVEKLTTIREEHGGEALLPYSYAGNMGKVNFHAGDPFFHRYGASRLNRTICSTAAKSGWALHYGSGPHSPPDKALDSDLIVAWGINAKVTNIHFMPLVVEARRRGAKFIVIDPYRNITAEAADDHFLVKPGGDTALALAVLKILITNNKVDRGFIENHSDGFAELEAYVAALDMATLVEKSGVSETRLRELAGLFADNPKTFIRVGVGLSRNTQGAMTTRAIVSLAAALGLFDGKAGAGALLSSTAFPLDMRTLMFTSLMEQPTRIINMVRLGEALTQADPPVKGLFVYSSNPLSVAPDGSEVKQGLAREDLFTVVHEQVYTDTTRYADLLLPATTSFENDDLYFGFGHFYMSRTEPVVQPRGEAISNFDLFQTLAQKMGFNDPVFFETAAERINTYTPAISGMPADIGAEIPAGETIRSTHFETAGNFAREDVKKFQFVVDTGDPALPRHASLMPTKELEDTALTEQYPFALITPPNGDLLNSTFGERFPNKLAAVMVHPADAERLDIKQGDRVEIVNQRGSHIREAQVTDRTQPNLLVAEGIYWQNAESGNSGVNDLTSQEVTDYGEGGTFHESRVKLRKVAN